uniref:Secreted protein n=1 Tax=Heterorhabditis bacteriophora TaxID=37862 RepID=A0A1I7WR92_HETBA
MNILVLRSLSCLSLVSVVDTSSFVIGQYWDTCPASSTPYFFEASMSQVPRISLMLIVLFDAVRKIEIFRDYSTFQPSTTPSLYHILLGDTENS